MAPTLESLRAQPLVPLPAQPPGVPWPTRVWPVGPPDADVDGAGIDALIDRAFASPQPEDLARTLAVVVVHRGRIVAERHAPEVDRDTTLISWSTAKSVAQAAAGILVRDGQLDIDAPAPVPEWAGHDDPRRAITPRQLVEMQPGLAWREDYDDAGSSDVIEMLFGSGSADMAAFAASFPLSEPPGSVLRYSSGTTNILTRLLGDRVGGGREGFATWIRRELFDPVGMSTATVRFDEVGTWVGSSYLYATARDFARFGLLYLRGGVWDGRRVLPEGWVDWARTPSGIDEELNVYGAGWWVVPDGAGTFRAVGYEHQYVVVVPARDLVVVRLAKTPVDRRPMVRAWLADLADCFPTSAVA